MDLSGTGRSGGEFRRRTGPDLGIEIDGVAVRAPVAPRNDPMPPILEHRTRSLAQ